MVPPYSIEILKLVIENGMIILAGIFMSFVMIVTSLLMFKGLRKLDLSHLFTSEGSGVVSSTKLWSNIAYFTATVAFLSINLFAPGTASLEMIWLVYLGTVASSALGSKMLALKYKVGDAIVQPPTPEAMPDIEAESEPPRRRRSRKKLNT